MKLNNKEPQLYCLFLFLLFTCLTSKGQEHNRPNIVNIYKEQYGGENKNWSLSEDQRGNIYIGNDIGLLEFDGIRWYLYSLPKTEIVRSVAALSHSTVFTGGVEEFGRWDRDISGKLKYTSLSKNVDKGAIKNNEFWKTHITDSCVYFQSFKDIYVYDFKTVKRIVATDGIFFLLKARDKFWVQGMKNSLYELVDNKMQKIAGSDIFANTDVTIVLPYSHNKYLIGTSSRGIYVYDGNQFAQWDSPISRLLQHKELNCGVLSKNGFYFFGTLLDGVYVTDQSGNIVDHISTANTLQNNTILSIYEDSFNNIWLGLDRGLAYVQYAKNVSYYIDSSGKTGAVYDAKMWNDKLFVATNQGLFYIGQAQLYGHAPFSDMRLIEGTQGQAWALNVIDNRLYCSHNKGLLEVWPNLTISVPYVFDSGVFSMLRSNVKGKDVFLLSTYTSLRMVDRESNSVYEIKQIPEPTFKSEIDHLGNVWLEHPVRGAYKCTLSDDLKSVSNYSYYGGNTDDGLPHRMKIFKFGGRILFLGENKFYTYDDISDKIIVNEELNKCFQSIGNIRKIVNVRNNIFLALTSDGFYKFSYDGYRAEIIDNKNFSKNMSLVNAYENAAVINDSISLICLDNGFLLYNYNDTDRSGETYLSVPYIESLETRNSDGQKIYQDLSIPSDIPYAFNTLTFLFLAKGAFTADLHFQYMLKGVEQTWQDAFKNNMVTYERLPIGKYTFVVRAVDESGKVSESLAYQFEVFPPWYQTFWMFIVYILVFVVVLYFVWTLILRRYRNLHLQKVRNREANRLKRMNDQLQNELEQKSAELLTQTSFIIKKNELIIKMKDIVEEFYTKNNSQTMAPLYQKINVLLNNNLDTEVDWKTFLFTFEQKHTGFFKKMKSMYPELTNNDLRLCACLKLNLDTKDIASLMNLSVRAVENNRYRLRKKMNLQPTQNLNDFFLHSEW